MAADLVGETKVSRFNCTTNVKIEYIEGANVFKTSMVDVLHSESSRFQGIFVRGFCSYRNGKCLLKSTNIAIDDRL